MVLSCYEIVGPERGWVQYSKYNWRRLADSCGAEIDRELKWWAYECRTDTINAEEVLRANKFQLLLLAPRCPVWASSKPIFKNGNICKEGKENAGRVGAVM
jgi:hypothetical protein